MERVKNNQMEFLFLLLKFPCDNIKELEKRVSEIEKKIEKRETEKV